MLGKWLSRGGGLLLALSLLCTPAAWGADDIVEPSTGYFTLRASSGYALIGSAPTPESEGHGLTLFFSKGQSFARYGANAIVAGNRVKANLGKLGRVDLEYVPTGRVEAVRAGCGRPIFFERGFFRGTLAFHGEEGFTEVRARRIRINNEIIVRAICGTYTSFQDEVEPGLPGARLLVASERGRRPPVLLETLKNQPAARTLFSAYVSERRPGIEITRGVSSSFTGPSAFEYDPSLQTARVELPAPFLGVGFFDRAAEPAGRWTGDLRVDFPGRSGFPLVGSAMGASLEPVHWIPEQFEGGRRPLARVAP